MKSIYFIDCLTVDLNVFIDSYDFKKEDEVVIVYYKGCIDLSLDCLHKLVERGVVIKTITSSKLDVDKILLVSLINRCNKDWCTHEFYVVSNDRGFNYLPDNFLPNGVKYKVLPIDVRKYSTT